MSRPVTAPFHVAPHGRFGGFGCHAEDRKGSRRYRRAAVGPFRQHGRFTGGDFFLSGQTAKWGSRHSRPVSCSLSSNYASPGSVAAGYGCFRRCDGCGQDLRTADGGTAGRDAAVVQAGRRGIAEGSASGAVAPTGAVGSGRRGVDSGGGGQGG